jgi:thiaminase/transcriptional activator TenA
MSFSGELWDGIADVYGAILAHPFITGLTDGTLPDSAFTFYVTQDALYLRQYARALALVGSRAPDAAACEMFARHAAEAISVEQQLHSSLLLDLGIDPAGAAAAEPAPCNLAYTSYLLSVASTGSFAEGVGAVLPCYWIYWEVGKELVRRGSPDARYQRWIDTYGGEEFGATVREVLAVTDSLGTGLAPAERARVHHAFRITSRYEWMFWDMGYRQESWPVLRHRAGRGVRVVGLADGDRVAVHVHARQRAALEVEQREVGVG